MTDSLRLFVLSHAFRCDGEQDLDSKRSRSKDSIGHTPSTAGTFRRKFRKNSRKTPEKLSELFLEFPSRVQLGSPQTLSFKAFDGSRAFPESSPPPQYGRGRLFFQKWLRRGPLRVGHGIPSSTEGISDSRNLFVAQNRDLHDSTIAALESPELLQREAEKHKSQSNRCRITEDGFRKPARCFFCSKTKGPGEKGAPRNHPEISSQKLADFERRFPYDSYGRDRAPFGPLLGEGFWGNIRRPLVLPVPLVYC